MISVVVLDDTLCRHGGTGVAELQSLGDVRIWPSTSPDEVVARCEGYDFVLTGETVLDAGMIARMEDVRYIGIMGPDRGQVDLMAAMRAGITVTAVPDAQIGDRPDPGERRLAVMRLTLGNLMAYLGGAPRNELLPWMK